jgi:hypothetical protein
MPDSLAPTPDRKRKGSSHITPEFWEEPCEVVQNFVDYVRNLDDPYFVLHENDATFKLLIRPKNSDGSLVELHDDIYRYNERSNFDNGYVLLHIRKDGRMFEAKNGVKYARLDSYYCGELGIERAYRLLADANKARIHHGWSKSEVLVMPPFPRV